MGVHRSTSLMSSSLLLQQCPGCLVRLTWIVFVMGGRWPYSWCLVGCCRINRLLRYRNSCQCVYFKYIMYGTIKERVGDNFFFYYFDFKYTFFLLFVCPYILECKEMTVISNRWKNFKPYNCGQIFCIR